MSKSQAHPKSDSSPTKRLARSLAGAMCLGFAFFGWPAPVSAAPQQNVLIILADDLGVDFVGVYGEGSDPAPTPNIDSLAAGGVLFRNAWANPSCSPTRASIQTGRYPFRTTVGRWIDYPHNTDKIGTLDPNQLTLPKVLDLDGAGYAHGIIGKWHMNYEYQGVDIPGDAGWSHFDGTMVGQVGSYFNWDHVVNGVPSTSTKYITTQQVDATIGWIQGQSQPWLCYLNFVAPHLPMHVPPSGLHTQNLAGISPTSSSRPHYKALIEAMDTEMGRLFQTLGPAVMANTNVIFIGDNGSVQNMAAAPFLGNKAKGTPYEGGLNVPLILSGPLVTNPGREVADLAVAADVFSTALDLAGALDAVPDWTKVDGVSLLPYMNETATSPQRSFAYAEEFAGTAWPSPLNNGHAMIRDDRYKLIQRMTKADEFFDLLIDPWEKKNLLSTGMSAAEQVRHATLVAEIATLRANTATLTTFGTPGCVGSTGLVPKISGAGAPKLGAFYSVGLSDAIGNAAAFQLMGFDAFKWQGLQLPLDLGVFGGGPGCELQVSPFWITAKMTGAGGTATHFVVVPNTPSLVGLTAFHQWVVVDPAAPGGSLGWVTSGGLAARVGL